ncbi:MAG: thiamine phosphate synthase [Desulfobacterales bacterium]|nr:thiamine phosphate synthase [Desulfobacterales bacterium]
MLNKEYINGVYLVIGESACGGKDLESIVEASLHAGLCCVQLREKEADTRTFLNRAKALKSILKGTGIPFLINDRIDIALAAQADGVHIGQSDMPYETARRLLGPQAIIGLSVESWDDVKTAQNLDVSYLGVSPVFDTPTKTDTKTAWGLEGLSRIRKASKHPLVAIGGIDKENARQVVQAGAHAIAVVSAICSAANPEEATRALNQAGF